MQCPKLHTKLCVRSLALECLDKKCSAKLHTKRCKRSSAKPRDGGKPNSISNQSSREQTHGGSRQGRKQGGTGQGRQRGTDQARQRATGQGRQQATGQGRQQGREDRHPQPSQDFPNLTVQPQLEAFMQALMKQQQELTRIALKEMTAQLGMCGVRGTCHSHSSC